MVWKNCLLLSFERLQDNETTSRDVSLFHKYKHTMKRLFLIWSFFLAEAQSIAETYYNFFALHRAFARDFLLRARSSWLTANFQP